LQKAFEAIVPGRVVLTVGHHPIDDLSEDCGRELRRILEARSQLHFFGHLHESKPFIQLSPSSQVTFLQAGPLYSDDRAPKAYHLVEFHAGSKRARVHIRTFKEARGQFDIGNEISPSGIFPSDKDSISFWASHAPPLNAEKLADWLRESCAPKLVKELDMTFAGGSLHEVYVFPPLAAIIPGVGEDELSRTEVYRNAIAVLSKTSNCLIYIPEEFGATSLIAFLALEAAKSPKKLPKPWIPLVIDIDHVKNYHASAERALRNAHPDAGHSEFGWRNCLVEQPYLVLIDNFRPAEETHKEALAELHSILPNAKYIVAARTQLAVAGTVLPLKTELPFDSEYLTLRPFNRAKVRELVRVWKLPPAFSENYVVDSIINRFQALSIPLTGPHISIFLTVLASQKTFSPINASTVIENFVEQLLEKPALTKIY